MKLQATTSQTVGPFFSIGMDWLVRENLAGAEVSGERVRVRGKVLDGDGRGVPDAILEVWQANAQGKYVHPEDTQEKPIEEGFRAFGRIPTKEDGSFEFTTIKPGSVPGPDGKEQAPHLVVSVFCRGLLRRLVTRMYFPGEPANDEDFALQLVPASRRETLIARQGGSAGELEWNVVLQGTGETVFFDC